MSPATSKSLNHIMGCFSGADGCAPFTKLVGFLRTVDQKAVDGDDAAQQIIDVLHKMSKLITISGRL